MVDRLERVLPPPPEPSELFRKAAKIKWEIERREIADWQPCIGGIRGIVSIPDDVLEKLGLGRPLNAILDVLEEVSPQGIADKLGIPTPGEIAETIHDEITRSVRRLRY